MSPLCPCVIPEVCEEILFNWLGGWYCGLAWATLSLRMVETLGQNCDPTAQIISFVFDVFFNIYIFFTSQKNWFIRRKYPSFLNWIHLFHLKWMFKMLKCIFRNANDRKKRFRNSLSLFWKKVNFDEYFQFQKNSKTLMHFGLINKRCSDFA